MKFRPLHDRVVIERIDAEAKTAGGIIIPDTAQEKPQQGKVIAVGQRNVYLKVRISPGKQNAPEEAPKADSIPSGEARQRSKPRQRIPGPSSRAADSAMLERHARRDCSSSSTTRHETGHCHKQGYELIIPGTDLQWMGGKKP